MTTNITYANSRHSHRCPACGRSIVRVRRRPLDRLHSVFVPVWRFACSDAACLWTGTLHRKDLRVPLIA